MKKRGQVSIEYLLITAFAFLFVIPLVTLFYTQTTRIDSDVTSSQVDKIASEIANAVNEVYYLGEPSKKTLRIFLPKKINNIQVTGNKLVFRVDSSSGDYDVVKWTATNMSGSIDTFSGIHNIEIRATLLEVQIIDG